MAKEAGFTLTIPRGSRDPFVRIPIAESCLSTVMPPSGGCQMLFGQRLNAGERSIRTKLPPGCDMCRRASQSSGGLGFDFREVGQHPITPDPHPPIPPDAPAPSASCLVTDLGPQFIAAHELFISSRGQPALVGRTPRPVSPNGGDHAERGLPRRQRCGLGKDENRPRTGSGREGRGGEAPEPAGSSLGCDGFAERLRPTRGGSGRRDRGTGRRTTERPQLPPSQRRSPGRGAAPNQGACGDRR